MNRKSKILIVFFVITFAYQILISQEISITYPSLEKIRPKVALVLSGGGARGIAQVGVLEVLEQKSFPYNYIVGTSIGSIIGGLVASGYSPFELDSLINSINWSDIFSLKEHSNRTDLFLDQKLIEDRSLITFRFKNFKFIVPEAISAGDQFNITLQRIFWNSLYKPHGNFDNLKYPFRAVATDLITGEPISQKSGNIITAIRASATVPLRYTPIRANGRILVDGGIFANIPVEQALEFNPDIIIAVNTVSPMLNPDELNTPWNIADQVITISMEKFTKKQKEKADFIITPPIGRHKNTDFSSLDTLILAGRNETLKIFPEIENKYYQKFIENIKNLSAQIKEEHIKNKEIQMIDFDSSEIIYVFSKLNKLSFLNEFYELIKDLIETDKYKSINIKINNKAVSFQANKFPVLVSINLTGATNQKVIDYANSYPTTTQQLLSERGIAKVKEDLLKKYRTEGYSYAVITSERIDDYGNVFFNIDEGTIGEVKIIGNEETSDFLIQREIKFKAGQIINADRLVRGWNGLTKTGLFSNVEIDIEENAENMMKTVVVKVTEGGTQTLRVGGKVDSERYGQIAIDAIQENLFNAGVRLSARTTIGTRNQDYSFWIENQRIFKSDFSLSASLYYSTRDINTYYFTKTSRYHFNYKKSAEYQTERLGAIAIFGRQLDKNGTISGTYRLEKQRFFNKSSAKPNYTNISTIKIAAFYDSEDRSFFARSGQFIELYLETGGIKIEPSVSFSKAYFYYHHNLTYGDFIIKPSVAFGAADKTLPSSEFFSLGGDNNFYGLREDAERGRQILRSSLEVRHKLPFKIYFDTYVSIRYDLGSVWLQPDEIEFDDLKHGIGYSIELDTPLGPGKFSVGRSFYFAKKGDIILNGPILYFSIGMRL